MTPHDTKTPRTDEVAYFPQSETTSAFFSPKGTSVYADFARTLERELAEAKADNATLRNAQKACEDCMTPTYQKLRDDLTAATRRIAELEAHAERLAGALDKISDLQKTWPGWGYQDLYEESQEIAGPPLAAYRADKERK